MPIIACITLFKIPTTEVVIASFLTVHHICENDNTQPLIKTIIKVSIKERSLMSNLVSSATIRGSSSEKMKNTDKNGTVMIEHWKSVLIESFSVPSLLF